MAWFIFVAIATVAPALAQQTPASDDFMRPRSSFAIVQLEDPIIVRSVSGVVVVMNAEEMPLRGVLFEIQMTSADKKIKRATTDAQGRFKILHIAPGTYQFRAILDGFQSVVGTIAVSRKAPKTSEIKIKLLVGV